jgi:L-threonate 2-dehydrogenase
MTYRVNIIGVGNMGGAMARNLLSKGWRVAVHDIDDAKVQSLKSCGAIALADIAYSATKSIATILCVVDATQTRDVLFGANGIAKALPLGHTVVLCPTLAPADVEQFAQALIPQGLHTIDAPMSGGPARAAEGTMSLMIACAEHVYARHQSLINALSNKVFRISEKPGDGARTKLVNNLLAAINLVGAAEALAMAQKMGLNLAKTLDVIEQSSGQSWIGSDRMRRALAGDYAPRAHMTLLEKDTRLAVDAARAVEFDGPLGTQARDVFAQASAGGLANLDDAALFRWLSDKA